MRAHRIAHAYIDRIPKNEWSISPRSFFDLLTNPTFTRVAPLPQLLIDENKEQSIYNWIVVAYYFVLKVVASGVLFGLPFVALCLSGWKVRTNMTLPNWAILGLLAGLAIAAGALIHVSVMECCQTFRTAKRFARGDPTNM